MTSSVELSLKRIDEWTDEQLFQFTSGHGPGMYLSTAMTIWTLEPNRRYSGLKAAKERGFEGKRARQMGGVINTAKCRKGLTKDSGKGEGVLYWSRQGLVLGAFLKTMIEEDGKVRDAKAMVRIALAPRLVSGLMSLAHRAPEARRFDAEDLTGQNGVVKQLDGLCPRDLRRVVWLLEGQNVEKPEIWRKLTQLSREEIREIVQTLGFKDELSEQREAKTFRNTESVEPIADHRVAVMSGNIAAAVGETAANLGKIKEQNREVTTIAGKPEKSAGVAAKDADAGPKTKRPWTFGVKEIPKRLRFNGLSPRARVLAFALCIGFAMVGVGAVNVFVREPGYILHVLKTKGAGAALNAFPAYFFDSAATHREKYEYAWALFVQGRVDESENVVSSLLNDNPSTYISGDCYYLLGVICLKAGDFYKSLSFYSQAEKEYKGYPAAVENVLLEKGRAFTLLGFVGIAEKEISKLNGLNPSNREKLHEIRYQIAAMERDFSKALNHAKERLRLNQETGNRFMAAASLTHVAYAYTALGDMENATEFNLQAQAMAINLNESEMINYIQVNWVLIRRCQGRPYQNLIDEIEEWASTSRKNLVIDFLYQELERISCLPGT